MEIVLNCVWAFVALLAVIFWIRGERSVRADRHLPIIALGLLLVILFPVISVSDDLWSLQNPAEADTCVRRNEISPCAHAILPLLASLPVAPLGETEAEARAYFAPQVSRPLPYAPPSFAKTANRPPPVG